MIKNFDVREENQATQDIPFATKKHEAKPHLNLVRIIKSIDEGNNEEVLDTQPFVKDVSEDSSEKLYEVSKLTAENVVIYNPYDLDSVFSAAIWKRYRPADLVVDVSRIIETSAEKYSWIGVPKDEEFKKVLKLNDGVQHSYIVIDEKAVTDETGYVPTLIETVCEALGVDYQHYQNVAFQMSRFYKPDADEHTLGFVYNGLLMAMESLQGNSTFDPNRIVSKFHEYMDEVKFLKRQLTSNYSVSQVRDAGSVRSPIYVNIQGYQFLLAKRLLTLAHAYYVNHVVGQNGTIIASNLKKPPIEQEKAYTLILKG
jgi:hypothetical protein